MTVIKRIMNYFGYDIRRVFREPQRAHAVRTTKSDFRTYFEKTEGLISLEEAGLLYTMARELGEGCVVEVGSFRGRSAVALGRGSIDGNKVPVYAIEPHEVFTGVYGATFGPEDRAAFYRAMLDTGCYEVVRLINTSSEIVSTNWSRQIGLLWIDGDHSYQGVKRDFECWEPHLTPGARVAFDDSTDPAVGPRQLINELVEKGEWQEQQLVGKVTVISRTDTRRLAQL